jgi:small subunit ribosomal protein S8
MFTDPIADMLTRIRNAGRAGHAAVLMPNSRVKTEIARVLQAQGYVAGYRHHDGVGAGVLEVQLKYHKKRHVVTGIVRESKPGQRRYVKSRDLPVVLNGFGIAVVTTSQGVMTSAEARQRGIGGEVICSVW